MKRWAAFLTIAVVVALRAMAYASPPDPSWIAGFWDDNDQDDVVILITLTSGIAETTPFRDFRPSRVVVASIPEGDEQGAPSPAALLHHSRAPPVA